MKKNRIKKLAIGFIKIIIPLFFLIVELLLLYLVFNNLLASIAEAIEIILRIFGALLAGTILVYSKHISNDVPTLLITVAFPLVGGSILAIRLFSEFFDKRSKIILEEEEKTVEYLTQDSKLIEEIKTQNKAVASDLVYITDYTGYPIYESTGFDYYPLGDNVFEVMLTELKKAERYIFLEYFIIEDGIFWGAIYKILKQKASEGVDVRLMYDDIGNLTTLPVNFAETVQKDNIKVVKFNALSPALSIFLNHRDHRKILSIDGNVVFSGGINLADEYINAYPKYGHWKDNAIRIKGDACYSYTIMFARLWNACSKDKIDYDTLKPTIALPKQKGYIAPYAYTPFNNDKTAEDVYLNIIGHANNYLYIMTPYLIPDSDMITALSLAAKRGVDVRIITPGIPDKKVVFSLTRSYYSTLISSGIRIFEYTPGFVHGKVFICDDLVATVGTANLDYRSLYIHFECGSYLYDIAELADIKKDFMETLEKCSEINYQDLRRTRRYFVWQALLRFIAPLL